MVVTALGLTVAGGLLLPVPTATASPGAVAASALTPAAREASVTVPAADVLDVAFAGGTTTDRAQGLAATTWGAPTYGNDAKLDREILTVDGVDDAVSFDFTDQYAKLADGFAIECVFRVDTAMPVSGEKDLCSNKEAGGFSVYVNGGNLGTMAHIGGGYKSVLTPVDGRRWYHALSVWDGSRLSLYLNGRLAGSSAATGALALPASTSRRFVVGADSAPNGIGQPAPPSAFAASKVWGQALTAEQATEAASAYDTAPDVPEADVLDVDLDDGTPQDDAQGLAVTTHGAPVIAQDTAVKKQVASFDGSDDAYSYAFGEQWSKLGSQVSVECTLKSNGTLPNSGEHSVCSIKEGGGFSMVIYGDKLTFTAHVGGAYRSAATQIDAGRWYHAVGTWDGTTVRLYVDGELAAEHLAAGALRLPSGASRDNFYVGADSMNQFWAPASVLNARVYSTALGKDQVKALETASFGDVRDAGVEVVSTVPATGDHLSSPTELDVDIRNRGTATGWTYLLDGKPTQPGDEIGAGMRSGTHTLEITATDVFGKPVHHTVTFTSDAIPSGGGTDTGQGEGRVSLSAIATNPDGGKVTTTFKEATPSVPSDGFQGVVPVMPSTLDFSYTEDTRVGSSPVPDGETVASPSARNIPFQRYDVEVPEADVRRQILWSGVVDPARSVALHVWHPVDRRGASSPPSAAPPKANTAVQARIRPELRRQRRRARPGDRFGPVRRRPRPARRPADEPDKDHFEDPARLRLLPRPLHRHAVPDRGRRRRHVRRLGRQARALGQDDRRGAGHLAAAYHDDHAVDRRQREGPQDRVHRRTPATSPRTTTTTRWPRTRTATLLYPGLQRAGRARVRLRLRAQETLDDGPAWSTRSSRATTTTSGRRDRARTRGSTRRSAPSATTRSARRPAGLRARRTTRGTRPPTTGGNTVTRGRDNQNNYVLFSAGGLDFVAVGLSYGVTPDEAEWADSIFKRFPDRNGILLTHDYLAPSGNPDGRGAAFSDRRLARSTRASSRTTRTCSWSSPATSTASAPT